MAIITSELDQESLLSNSVPCSEGGVGRSRSQLRTGLMTKNKRRLKMSRRANLIGICGITGICILLLIATTQHRPSPPSTSVPINGVGGKNQDIAYSPEGFNLQHAQSPSIAYNLTASIVDVLTAQRSKIAIEMENFEYPSRFGVDGEKLSDLTPETNGTPPRSIIITTWRSGSTFLGDILNAMPGNFYHYEPLLNVGIKQIRDNGSDEANASIQTLKNLLKCDYTSLEDYLEYGTTHTYMFEHNERLWSVCKEFPYFCWNPKFLTPFCKMFPLQSMKTVRLRLSLAEQLLDDNSLNVRIILLVRDPRGTMQSRKHRVWCAGNTDCDEPSSLCDDLISDYHSTVTLLKKYPTRFRPLRYEDLSLNPYEMTQEILQFYGLPFDPMVEDFLDTHTKINIGGVSSTYRDSRSAPFHWKHDLKIDEVKHIEKACSKAMGLWGYKLVENFTDFQRNFDPLILPPPFT